MAETQAVGGDSPVVTAPGKVTVANLDHVKALIAKANNGDKKALAELVNTFGSAFGVWDHVGDIAASIERAWLRKTYGDDQLYALEGARRKLAKLREELNGPNPTPLERLLVERILACHLAVNYADVAYCQNVSDWTMEWRDYYQRRIDRSQRRYLDAVLALAKVRRLALPAVQVNIGERQVNVAS